jgi:hypothetical protein
MKTAIITAALSLALVGSAAAQPGMTPQMPTEPAPAPVRTEKLLSESHALTLSLGGTLGSLGLIACSGLAGDAGALVGLTGAIGFVLAPSFGHWYAGKYFTRGLGLRLLGGAAGTVGLIWGLGQAFSGFCDHSSDEEDESEESAVPIVLLLGGLGMYIYGTVDDIVTAPRRVRRHNERLNERLVDVTVAPLAVSRGGGLALTGRF